MTKQEYMAMSLTKGLVLQSPSGFIPNGKESTGTHRLVYLTGDLYADIENKIFPGEFIPICRPLSDLTKEIEHKGDKFVPIDELNNIIDDESIGFNDHYIDYENPDNTGQIDWLNEPFIVVMWLIEHYFDIYGLIDKGEAIDVNSLDTNPYK